MSLRLSQTIKLSQTHLSPSTLVGLDDFDVGNLEDLLHAAKEEIKLYMIAHPKTKGSKGNFFYTQAFRELIQSFKDNQRSGSLKPALSLKRSTDPSTLSYNEDLYQNVNNILQTFTSETARSPAESFSRTFLHSFNHIKESQERIASYLLEQQQEYLSSLDIFDLKPITQHDVEQALGYESGAVSKLTKHLDLYLEDKQMTLSAKDLMPANRLQKLQAYVALKELTKDPELYEQGWKVKDAILQERLEKDFGISGARRTIAKYRQDFDNYSQEKDTSNMIFDRVYQDLEFLKSNPLLFDPARCRDAYSSVPTRQGWTATPKQLAKILSAEYERDVPEELVDHIITNKAWIGEMPCWQDNFYND